MYLKFRKLSKRRLKKVRINALAGDDKIIVRGGSKHIINTGKGNDKVFLKKGNGHTVTLGTAKKKNTVTVSAGTGHIIKGSTKADELKITAGTVKKATLGKGNDEFGQTFVAYEEAGGHDGEAGVLAVGRKFAEFLFGEQEFAVTLGFMIVVGSECVLGYMHALDPELSVYERAVTVGQAGF